MDGSNITSCNGTFSDSGGLAGDYQPGENFTTTICSNDPTNGSVNLIFSNLDISVGDTLIIYDSDFADPTAFNFTVTAFSSTFQFPASIENPSGCVTVVFRSNGDTNVGGGWQAQIECYQPCQRILLDLEASIPAVSPPDTGYVDICLGEEITLRAVGIYPQNNIAYQQDDSTTEFAWDFGTGDTLVIGQEASYTYDQPGGYFVNVTLTDTSGCKNINYLNQRIRIAAPPTVELNLPEPICGGDTIVLHAAVNNADSSAIVQVIPEEQFFPVGGIVSGTLPLPDGTGAIYETTVNISSFDVGQTISAITDILSVGLNIEHTWMHDIEVFLICPNGQSTALHESSFIYNEVYLGIPDDNDNLDPNPGTGFNYSWDPNATVTWNDWSSANPFTPGNPVTLPEGTYAPEQQFTNLLGCPLNGDWTLQVTDFLAQDNGFIFSWIINFDPDILSSSEAFTTQIDASSWELHPTAFQADALETAVSTNNAGTHFYNFTYTDDFGCPYDTLVPISFLPSTHPDCENCCPLPFDILDQVLCPGDSVVLSPGIDTLIEFPVGFGNYYINRDFAIPSNSVGYDTAQVTFVLPEPITDVAKQFESICVNIFNPSGDPFRLSLISPNGTSVLLSDGITAPFNAFTNTCFAQDATQSIATATPPFSGTYLPLGNFADFADTQTTGDWLLEIETSGNPRTIELLDWELTFNYQNVLTYDWSPATGLNCTDCPEVVANPSTETTYFVEVTDTYGNVVNDSITIFTIPGLLAPEVSCISSRDSIYFSWVDVANFDQYDYRLTINGTQGAWEGPITGNAFIVSDLDDLDEVTLEVRAFANGTALCDIPVGSASCTIDYCGARASFLNKTDVSCAGLTDGSIEIQAEEGDLPFSFSIDGFATSQNTGLFTGLAADDYLVLMRDATGCTDSIFIEVEIPPAISIDVQTLREIDCAGTATGQLGATAQGGTGAITITWTGPITGSGETLFGAAAGQYTVRATDTIGCFSELSYNLLEPPILGIQINIDSISCTGAADGAISVGATGGASPYQIGWSDNSSDFDRTDLGPNTYCFTLRDNNGCRIDSCLQLFDPVPLVVDSIRATDISCSNVANGEASVFASGGSGPLSYVWNDTQMQATATATQLVAGNYTVLVSDANNCVDSASTMVTAPPPLSIQFTVQDALCLGGHEGAVFASGVGGVPPYTYDWGDGNMTDSTTALSAGVYSLTLSDSNGCTFDSTATVNEPSMAIELQADQSLRGCAGANENEATAVASNGTPAYSYLWQDAQVGPTAIDLAPGTYSVTVTDQNNCSDSTSVSVVDLLPLSLDIDRTEISCFGAADATVTLSASGGDGQYSFLWDDANTQDNRTGLGAATYCVQLTDNSGCQLDTCISFTNPVRLQIDSIQTLDLSCNGNADGLATVFASGGTGTLTYSWNTSPPAMTETISDLSAGDYTVVVADSNACSVDSTISIVEPSALEVTFTEQNILCRGDDNGTVLASPSGGTAPYSFDWGNGQTFDSLSMLTPGDYVLTITDASNCVLVDTATITEPVSMLDVSAVQTSIGCNGQNDKAALATATDGAPDYTFVWSDNQMSAVATNLASGVYTVTVTDQLGCQDSTQVSITDAPPLVLSIDTTAISCFGASDGAMTAICMFGAGGPYEYAWSTGQISATITGLSAGNYCVTATDSNGCTIDSCLTLSNPPLILIDTLFAIDISCQGSTDGQAIVGASGGTGQLAYSWSTSPAQNDSIAINLAPDLYTVSIIDERGCQIDTTLSVTEPPLLSVDFVVIDVNCRNGSDGAIMAATTGGVAPYQYEWENGHPTDSLLNVPAGMYTITITDANNCTLIATATVGEPALAIQIQADQSLQACVGTDANEATAVAQNGTPDYNFTWEDMQTGPTAVNLAPGTYGVTVTDQNNCTDSTTVTLIDLPALSVSIDRTEISCFGAANATVSVTPMGGDGNYTLLWDDANNQPDRTGLDATTYCLQITDGSNCQLDTCISFTNPPALLIDSLILQDVSCSGLSDGQATVFPTGGTGGYTYQWDDPLSQITATADQLPPTTIEVMVMDANGCTASASGNIQEPDSLSIDFLINDVRCLDGSDGSIYATVHGGTPPYSYDWGNGNLVDSLTNLSAGMYTLTVTDAHACTYMATAMVEEPAVGIVIQADQSLQGCAGSENNEATAFAENGTLPYQFIWEDLQTGPTAVDLAPGTYGVTVTDQNNCTDSTTVTLIDLPALSVNIDRTEISCFGAADGTLSLSPMGGDGNYTFLWDDANTQPVRTDLDALTYCVQILDNSGCQLDTCITFMNPLAIAVDSIVTQEVTCPGDSDGTATVFATGGTGPLSFIWDDAAMQNTNTAIGLDPGNYSVTVTDSLGCQTAAVTMVGEPLLLAIDFVVNNVACLGDSSGTVVATGQGGTAPYTYLWGNGSTTDSLHQLTAGTYMLTVTDLRGCSFSDNVTVSEPQQAISLSADQSKFGCKGEDDNEATALVSNGNPPYDFQWQDGQSGPLAVGLSPGFYTLSVTDGNGCQDTTSVTITEPDSLLLSIDISNITCHSAADGSISITPSGGIGNYTYNWSDGNDQNIRTGLVAATYCVTVSDDNMCQTDTCFTLNSPPALVVEDIYSVPTQCNGTDDGQAIVVVSGGIGPYTYSWDDDLNQIVDTAVFLAPATYTVQITDASGCQITASTLVTEPTELQIDFTIQDALCVGGNEGWLLASGQGGTSPYTYDWGNGNVQDSLTNLVAGTYEVTLTDARGCTAIAAATVNEPDLQIELSADQTFMGCAGTTDNEATAVVMNGTPAYRFLWEDGQEGATAVDLASGTYSLTVTDTNGCQDSTSVSVMDLDSISFFLILDPPSCAGIPDGAMAVNQISGGIGTTESDYSFNWSTGAQTIGVTNLAGGQTYRVTVTDAQGCEKIKERMLPTTDTISFVTTLDEPTCFAGTDGTILISDITGPNPGFTYQWDAAAGSQQTAVATGLAAGTYSLTITDDAACTHISEISIGQPNPLQITFDIDPSNCFGAAEGAVEASVSGGSPVYSFVWSTGATGAVVQNLPAGTYSVAVTDSLGCQQSASVTLDEPPPQAIDYVVEDVDCFGDQDGSIVIQPMGGVAPYEYALNNQNFGANPAFIGLTAGSYTVYTRDSEDCVTVNTVDVLQPPLFQIDAGMDTTIFYGDSVTLIATPINPAGSIEVIWSAPYEGTLSCSECQEVVARPLYTIDYEVYAIDADGCEATDQIRVLVEKNREILVPTGFTPNGDNVNDLLLVHGIPGTIVKHFRIFDRWGELIHTDENFPVNDINRGWDGTFRDQALNAGIYIWQVIAEFPDGSEESYSGETTLIR